MKWPAAGLILILAYARWGSGRDVVNALHMISPHGRLEGVEKIRSMGELHTRRMILKGANVCFLGNSD